MRRPAHFGHDLTLEAVRASVPVSCFAPSINRRLVLRRGSTAVEEETQLAESAEEGDEVAIATLLKAAETLGTTDPGTAADWAKRPRTGVTATPLAGASVAQTAVWSHAAGRGERRGVRRHCVAFGAPARQEAEVHLSVAGMFALSPDVRARPGAWLSPFPVSWAPMGTTPGAVVPQPGDSGPLQ